MPQTNIYCKKGHDVCLKMMNDAINQGLKAVQSYPKITPSSFDIFYELKETSRLDTFLSQYCDNRDIMIYYDHTHRNCTFNSFRVSTKTPLIKTKATNPYISGVPDDINPASMKTYYNIPLYDPQTIGIRPQIAVISLGGYYNPSDFTYYWENICLIPPTGLPTVTNHLVSGNILPTFARNLESIENTLDIELIGGFCPNADIHFYSAPNTYLGYKQAFVDAIADGMNLISTSWGQTEDRFYGSITLLDDYDAVFETAVNNGIIICAAAGDFGSSDNDYRTFSIVGYSIPVPVPHVNFPASSPHVVACGGTSLFYDVTNPVGNQETAWVYGGGGQSGHFQRPLYQGAWNPNWPVSPIVYGGTSTPNARTLPDISFNADPNSPWHIYFDGYDDQGSGTSACSPIMTSLLGIYYSISDPASAPRQGYFGSGFNYFLYNAPSSTTRTIGFGFNITVDRDPITTEINPFGLFLQTSNTYYAIFEPQLSFCTGRGAIDGVKLFNYLNGIVCVVKGTRILMSNGQYKPIEQIVRGDMVIGYNGHIYKVATINHQVISPNEPLDMIELPPNSLGKGIPVNKLLITPNHPIFFKGARRPAKCFKLLSQVVEHRQVKPHVLLQKELQGSVGDYLLYDLQFDEDGSYIAEGLAIQSRSPWSDLTPLDRDLYFDQSRYTDQRHWDSLHHQLPLDLDEVLP
jgi:hypothetical protein